MINLYNDNALFKLTKRVEIFLIQTIIKSKT